MKTMRIHHDCNRGLADVTHSDYNAAFTPDGLMVIARPGVNQRDYRPWEAALHGHLPREELAKDPAIWQAHTYTWWCRCAPKSPVSRRHEQISKCWQQHGENSRPLVRVTLGIDL